MYALGSPEPTIYAAWLHCAHNMQITMLGQPSARYKELILYRNGPAIPVVLLDSCVNMEARSAYKQ